MAWKKAIWPVGGGKGGAGKSVVAANIGCALAMTGRRVVLVDAGPAAGAGLHACFGIGRPARGLDDLIDLVEGRPDGPGDAAVETGVEGLRLISGAGEYLAANPPYRQRHKLIARLRDIDADCVIVDLGSGSSYNALDLFAISKTGIIVMAPEPASVQNAYTFLKSFVYRLLERLFAPDARMGGIIKDATDARKPGSVRSLAALCEKLASVDEAAAQKAAAEIASYRPRLLLNMAASEAELKAVEAFSAAAKGFLGIDAPPAGVLRFSQSVEAASRKGRPFMLDPGAAGARNDIALIVEALLADQPHDAAGAPAKGQERKPFGFNDNVPHKGEIYHVQTEAHGGADPVVETIVYIGGRVFFSKRVVCREDGGTPVRDFARRQHNAAMAAIKMDKIKLQG